MFCNVAPAKLRHAEWHILQKATLCCWHAPQRNQHRSRRENNFDDLAKDFGFIWLYFPCHLCDASAWHARFGFGCTFNSAWHASAWHGWIKESRTVGAAWTLWVIVLWRRIAFSREEWSKACERPWPNGHTRCVKVGASTTCSNLQQQCAWTDFVKRHKAAFAQKLVFEQTIQCNTEQSNATVHRHIQKPYCIQF